MPWCAALPYCSVYMVLLRCAELSCCSIFKFLRWIRFIIDLLQCTLACGKYYSKKVKLLCIDNTEYSTATCYLSRDPQHCVVFPHWQDALPSSSFLSFFFLISFFFFFFLLLPSTVSSKIVALTLNRIPNWFGNFWCVLASLNHPAIPDQMFFFSSLF